MSAAAARLRGIAVVAYAAAMVFLALHHEPWRDEADVWLAARDTSLPELFSLFGYMGTPSLWYLLVRPLARLGIPYESMLLLHVAIATAVAALVLWKSTFPLPVRLLLVFSYYFGYEYSILARPYALTILLLFAIASVKQPIPRAMLIALLASASTHGAIIAAFLGLEALWRREKPAALAVMAAGGAAAWLQLRRPPDAQITGTVHAFDAQVFIDAIGQAFLPFTPPVVAFLAGAAVIALAVAALRDDTPHLIFYCGATLALLFLFAFVWAGGTRHYGLLMIVTVFAMWTGPRNDAWRRCVFLLGGCLAVSIIPAANHWYLETRYAYSGAKEAATYLRTSGLDEREVAAHNTTQAGALLPYLPGKKFWYLGRGEYGTYMKWDRRLDEAVDVPYPVAEELARRGFAGKKYLLLFNVEIPDASRRGWRLVYGPRTPVFGRSDERYWIYEPVQ